MPRRPWGDTTMSGKSDEVKGGVKEAAGILGVFSATQEPRRNAVPVRPLRIGVGRVLESGAGSRSEAARILGVARKTSRTRLLVRASSRAPRRVCAVRNEILGR